MQRNPDVAVSADGSTFLVVWDSLGSSSGDIASFSAQGITLEAGRLFESGFEDGTADAWSGAVP